MILVEGQRGKSVPRQDIFPFLMPISVPRGRVSDAVTWEELDLCYELDRF